MKFYKNGRYWYTTKKEVMKEREKGERVYFDAWMRAYYLVKIKAQPYWNF